MSNSLVKTTIVTTHPGVGYVPATPTVPARDVYETRQVCNFVSVGLDQGNPLDGTPNASHTGSTYMCSNGTVLVHYPAKVGTPGKPGTPSTTTTNFNLGWNAGGRSIAFVTGDGSVSFQARESIVGAIVGLNVEDGVDSGGAGTTIDFAFQLAHGIARVMQNGVSVAYLGTYTGDTVFSVVRTGTDISYQMDGTEVFAAAGASVDAAWLEASLYSGDDEVFNPVITQISPPDLTAGTGELSIALAPLLMRASQGVYGELDVSLPPMTFAGGIGQFLPSYGLLSIVLPPLISDGFGLTGEIGSLNIQLPTLQMQMADRPYGELKIELPRLAILAVQDPPGVLYLADLLSFDVPMLLTSMDQLTLRDAFSFDIAMSTVLSDSMHVTDAFSLDVVMSFLSAERLDVQDAFYFDVPMSVPGADLEVWAVSLDGFGSTSYANYSFNSMARIGDHYFGAKDDGIFSLAGDTDAGEGILAAISPGKLDFGTSHQKVISEWWMGLSSSAPMKLVLQADGETYDYLTDDHCENLEQQRIKLGKGLKANYLTPTLFNTDGCDFEIDALELTVATLTRKT